MKLWLGLCMALFLPLMGDVIVKTDTGFVKVDSLENASQGEAFVGNFIDAAETSLPNTALQITEVTHSAIQLEWTENEKWEYPWLIQRSRTGSFYDPLVLMNKQSEDNTGKNTFRWLGINATNYRDIDNLEEATTYYYRVAAVTNLHAHFKDGDLPKLTKWKYGKATTTTLALKKKRVYDVEAYGAVPDDGQNDYPAVLKALQDAEAAGGGIIYFPGTGLYDLWPTDSTVKLNSDGSLTVQRGQSYTTTLFIIKEDNITFEGAALRSKLKFYLWHKQPATKWLSVMNNGVEVNVRRYNLFLTSNIEKFTVKDLSLDMGAVPVQTGKQWYSLDEKKYQWDISHKFIASFDTYKFRDVVIDNVEVLNCRAEMVYNGGGSEKILIKNSEFHYSNSSTLSGSFDMELVNCVITESANAAIESALQADTVSPFTGKETPQNTIARGCTFVGIRPNSVMANLPGKKYFGGWHVFNEAGTYQTCTDSTFKNFIYTAFGPWHEYNNGFRFNCSFSEVYGNFSGNIFSLDVSPKPDYRLGVSMKHVLWMGDTITVTKNWPNHQPFLYTAGAPTNDPWIWDSVEFKLLTPSATINRIWSDVWSKTNMLQETTWSNWYRPPALRFSNDYLEHVKPTYSEPTFENFLK